jgi:hypothetical protein
VTQQEVGRLLLGRGARLRSRDVEEPVLLDVEERAAAVLPMDRGWIQG